MLRISSLCKLGFRYNAKGYKVLANHVRVIQGDGITRRSLPEILDVLIAEKLVDRQPHLRKRRRAPHGLLPRHAPIRYEMLLDGA